MRRREHARHYGRNGAAVVALLEVLARLTPDAYRGFEAHAHLIQTPLFSAAAVREVAPLRRARAVESRQAHAAAWRVATSIEIDPDYRGSRLVAEVAAMLTFADLLEPERLAAVRDAFCAALGDPAGCAAAFDLVPPRRSRAA